MQQELRKLSVLFVLQKSRNLKFLLELPFWSDFGILLKTSLESFALAIRYSTNACTWPVLATQRWNEPGAPHVRPIKRTQILAALVLTTMAENRIISVFLQRIEVLTNLF